MKKSTELMCLYGFNYVVYAEKYVHMDELKQLVVDVMESEEYKAGK